MRDSTVDLISTSVYTVYTKRKGEGEDMVKKENLEKWGTQ